MLINFTVENWMCFRERAEFSMLASRERQHNERVPYVKNYKEKVLPISAIYGGNASGKSAFCRALHFVKNLVVNGTRKPNSKISVSPFRLDKNSHKNASRFEITIMVDENEKEIMYEFNFSANNKEILTENLYKLGKKEQKELIYNRKKGEVSFGKKYDEDGILKFITKNTRPNQLFLTNSILQNNQTFKPIYDWFENTLVVISPISGYAGFGELLNKKSPLYKDMQMALSQMDTGIAKLDFKKMPLEKLPIPKSVIENDELEEDFIERFVNMVQPDESILTISKKEGELQASELISLHKKIGGGHEKFSFGEESDGTVRLTHLLPGFLSLAKTRKDVFVIDELDRSMHSLLTEALIEFYLRFCSPDSRSQLIFTTHDTELMTQANFRRDEIWLTKRDSQNKSEIYSLSDFKGLRFDKNLRNNYLLGALGGVPRIRLRASEFSVDLNKSS